MGECGVPLRKLSKKEKYDRSMRDDSCVSNEHRVPFDVIKSSVRLLFSARPFRATMRATYQNMTTITKIPKLIPMPIAAHSPTVLPVVCLIIRTLHKGVEV